VRLALGATPRQVSGLVLTRAFRLCSLGLLIGGALAWGVGRLLAGQLLDVRPGDPLTFLLVAALLAAVIWIAAGLPARRASRLDPAEVLRAD